MSILEKAAHFEYFVPGASHIVCAANVCVLEISLLQQSGGGAHQMVSTVTWSQHSLCDETLRKFEILHMDFPYQPRAQQP